MTGEAGGALGGMGDVADLVEGAKSGIEHSRDLARDLGDGHYVDAMDDGVSVVRDVAGIVEALGGLGVHYGKVATKYVEKFTPLAESQILSAAQKVIEGAKRTTGEGDPDPGDGFKESAARLQEIAMILWDAKPHSDRWTGAASDMYSKTSSQHSDAAFKAQNADQDIANVLAAEADLVRRTRENLDEVSEGLHQFDLATMWMNAHPAGAAIKETLDAVAAAGAMEAMQITMLSLFRASAENAGRIRTAAEGYEGSLKDSSGDGGACGGYIFVAQKADLANLPERLRPETSYTAPAPEEPPQWGPPAQPLPSPSTTNPPPAKGQ